MAFKDEYPLGKMTTFFFKIKTRKIKLFFITHIIKRCFYLFICIILFCEIFWVFDSNVSWRKILSLFVYLVKILQEILVSKKSKI